CEIKQILWPIEYLHLSCKGREETPPSYVYLASIQNPMSEKGSPLEVSDLQREGHKRDEAGIDMLPQEQEGESMRKERKPIFLIKIWRKWRLMLALRDAVVPLWHKTFRKKLQPLMAQEVKCRFQKCWKVGDVILPVATRTEDWGLNPPRCLVKSVALMPVMQRLFKRVIFEKKPEILCKEKPKSSSFNYKSWLDPWIGNPDSQGDNDNKCQVGPIEDCHNRFCDGYIPIVMLR
ncbi:hypothetical protein KI387_020047, partial [Taxus chinensis]